jgi:ATP-dependent DNA helicase RecG
LVVTPDTIMVKSPGKPVEPITLEQMQSFDAPMSSRNPVLHYVFARMELAEERGLGLKSMRTRAEKAGLPLPTFAMEGDYLVLTIFRSAAAVVKVLGPEVVAHLNSDEQSAWQFIVGQEFVTSGALMKQMDLDERKAQRILRKLRDVGLLQLVGKGRATRFRVVRA